MARVGLNSRAAFVALALLLCGATNADAQFFGNQQQEQDWISNWVFQGRSEKDIQSQLQSDCQMRLKMLDRVCDLSDSQMAKMTTAGDGDVTRFFRDVAQIRSELKKLGLKGNDNNDINQMWQIVSPLSQQFQKGMFAEKSLFQKVMRSALSEEQQDLYQAALDKNRKRRWKTLTRINVAEIEKSMPLLTEQREKLLELLDAQELPDKIDKHMDASVGYLKLLKAKMQDEDLGDILDKQQMAVIQKYCDRYRGWENRIK